MKKLLITIVSGCLFMTAMAQDRIPTSSMWLKAYPVSGAQVKYAYDGTGPEYRVAWGMDVAWNDGNNVKRGVNYIGKDILTTGRVSFQPTDSVGEDLILSDNQIAAIRSRIFNISVSKPLGVLLNLDIPGEMYDSYRKYYKGKPYEYYKVIKASVLKYKELGMKIISIAPFNEPDYTYNEVGNKREFLQIVKYIAADPDLAGIRICAGNTLNDDRASEWYNYMKPYVNEGNTHQLAGNFDNYAAFFQEVRRDGNHATADELHNTMEAFVAAHYGLQTGIWWGYDGLARGEYCKASKGGQELGYAENRSAWAAGAVYRLPNGSVKGFVGVSERQANKNRIDLVATDKDVFYEGYGPVRMFQQFLPGDGVYGSENQKNADRVIHILSGEDVPLDTIGGQYAIMSKKTGKVLAPANQNSGSAIQQATRKVSNTIQRWNITPTPPTKGGDFSYFYVKNEGSGYYMNLLNYDLEPGPSKYIAYDDGGADNEQYYFEYAGDGWYYIRNHFSGLYLETSGTTIIRQDTLKGNDAQKWRLLPPDGRCETNAPSAPTGLRTLAHPASVVVAWNDNTETDLASYIVLRGCEKDGEIEWETIGRNITSSPFVDNSCEQGLSYKYKIKAVDFSGNRSEDSEIIDGAPTAEKALIAEYEFDQNLIDNSVNVFDAVQAGEVSYLSVASQVKSGSNSLSLDGKDDYLLLPSQVANLRQLTISAWVYNGDSNTRWMRVFDFGNGTDQYMFFTPSNGTEARFVIKNGGDEQILSTSRLGVGWKYVTITMGENDVKLYINGEEVASSADITIRPADFKPALCYIGRSQYLNDPLFKGRVDDFRIYNYPLSPYEIKADMEDLVNSIDDRQLEDAISPVISTEYYNLSGARTDGKTGRIVIKKELHQNGTVTTRKVMR